VDGPTTNDMEGDMIKGLELPTRPVRPPTYNTKLRLSEMDLTRLVRMNHAISAVIDSYSYPAVRFIHAR